MSVELTLVQAIQDKLDNLHRLAIKTLSDNQNCYVAQWILQNPDKNISDYTLVQRRGSIEDFMQFSIERKE